MFRIGTDICSIARISKIFEHHGRAFLAKLMSEEELALVDAADDARKVSLIAGRFAGKEALAKALGTGIGAVAWRELAILRGERGEPLVRLSGKALELANHQGLQQWQISISHEKEYAVAFVVAAAA